MQLAKVTASHRQIAGKNLSSRMRAAGSIPAVAYGKGEPALNIAGSPKDLIGVLAQRRVIAVGQKNPGQENVPTTAARPASHGRRE